MLVVSVNELCPIVEATYYLVCLSAQQPEVILPQSPTRHHIDRATRQQHSAALLLHDLHAL